jgi:methylphosphotriester-DNA--protein-cysteine methyltransferase
MPSLARENLLQAHTSARTRVCPGCDGLFVPTRANQVCCRPSCRARATERRRQRDVDLFTSVADAVESEVTDG